MKALFVNENIGGHVTVHRHLRATLAKHTELDVEFLDVPRRAGLRRLIGARIPSLARLDLDLQPLRAQIATSAWVRRQLIGIVDRFDVVHVYTQNAALLSADILADVPTVVSLDSTNHLNSTRLPYREPTRFTATMTRFGIPLEQRVFRSADRVIANSDWVADSLLRNYELDANKLEIFPFGIVAPEYDGAAPGPPPGDLPTLVFIGRQLERKGGRRLLRLHQDHLLGRARLVLVTEEDVEPAPDVTVIHDLAPGDARLWEILRGASAFVFPSVIDQSPNSVIEAMAAGLPVIGISTAALPEMVLHGGTGLLIEPDDPDEVLLAAIERFLDDPNMRVAFGRAARRRFEERYDATASTDRLVKVLREVTR